MLSLTSSALSSKPFASNLTHCKLDNESLAIHRPHSLNATFRQFNILLGRGNENKSDHRVRRGWVRASLNIEINNPDLDLTGKSVTVVGLGKSGISAALLALCKGAECVVGMDKNESAPALQNHPEIIKLGLSHRVRTEYGAHNESILNSSSLIILSPGVPSELPVFDSAKKKGIPIYGELSFAYEFLPKNLKICAVSGTNGKSTVTSFAGQFLNAAGVKTFVGGNYGVPLSDLVLEVSRPEYGDESPYEAAVVEVSSYQMENPGNFSPKCAAIINLTPDHLERHKSLENYAKIKCRLFQHMNDENLAVIPVDDDLLRQTTFASSKNAKKAYIGGLPGVQLDSLSRRSVIFDPVTGSEFRLFLTGLKTVGRFNAYNAGLAALLSANLSPKVDETLLQAQIPNLVPLPHRMQIVRDDEDNDALTWINDSKSTNVDSALVAVESLGQRKAVVLLGGIAKVGVDGKSFGFQKLVPSLSKHRSVITFGASGQGIQEELVNAGLSVNCLYKPSLPEAVSFARSVSKSGDVILLTPGCASFDEFQNFEHRGRVFTELALTSD